MSGGRRTPTTLNSNNLNGTEYTSFFYYQSGAGDTPEFSPVSAEIAGDFSDYVRAQPESRVLTVRVKLDRKGTGNHFADVKQLKQWVNPRDGEVLLKATDDGGNTLRLTVVPLQLVPVEGLDWDYEIRLWVPKPIWQNDTEHTHTEASYTGGAIAPDTNNGNDYAAPTITATPVSYPANTVCRNKQRRVVVANRSPLPLQDIYGNPYPIEITNGGWDVETKVKAGTLHPQGYDILVYVDGVPSERYLSNYGAGYGRNTLGGTDHTLGNVRSFCNSAAARHAVKFRLPGCSETETNTVDEAQFALDTSGSPTGTVTAVIREDSSGLPGSVIATSNTVTIGAGVIDATDRWVSFTFGSPPSLNAKTWYWLELTPPSGTNNASNYVRSSYPLANGANYENEVNTMAHSPDGTTWTAGSSLTGIGAHDSNDQFGPLNFRIFVTGTAKIWVPMLCSGGVRLNTNGQTTSTPNTTIRITDFEGHVRLPDEGYVVKDSECLQYLRSASDRFELTASRARRGTSNASHAAGPMYWVEHYVQVVFNYQESQPRKPDYEPDGLSPVIDGRQSTNSKFYWVGPFLSPGVETRPMTWAAEQDDTVDAYDGISLNANVTTDLGTFRWRDLPAAGAYIARNAVAQNFPTGIKAAASAITFDHAQIAASMQIDHLLTNAQGEEEIFDTFRNDEAGSGKTMTPTDIAYRWRMRASAGMVTGCETSDAADYPAFIGIQQNYQGQTFAIDTEATVTAAALRMKKLSTPTFTAQLIITTADDDGVPEATIVAEAPTTWSQADVTTSYQTFVRSFTNPIVLAPGNYWIGVAYSGTSGWSGSAYPMLSRSSGSIFARGTTWGGNTLGSLTEPGSNNNNKDAWFRIFGSPIQADAPQATGGVADADDLIVDLDTTTPGTPLVIFESSDQDVYHLNGTIAVSGGNNIGIDALTQTSRVISMNWETYAFTNSDTDVLDDCPYIITSEALNGEGVVFAPGAVSVTAPAPAAVTYVFTYREPFR